MIDTDLEILNCKECKNFSKFILHIKKLEKVFYYYGALGNRLEEKRNLVVSDFIEHLNKHFPEEEKKE